MKAELQLLRLNEDIQSTVLSTLKHIHGVDFELGEISDYKDLGSKIKNAYWNEKGSLVVQGGTDFSNVSNQGFNGDRMKLYALMKLESYGFHRSHCNEVLDTFNENIDDSINMLFDKYFPQFEKNSEVMDHSIEELNEMRSDEKEALKSIYDKIFHEIEENHIWQFKLRLDHLFVFSPSEIRKQEKQKQLEIEQKLQEMLMSKKKKTNSKQEKCRNMLEKGKCRFGHNCRFSHNIYDNCDDGRKDDASVANKKLRSLEEDDEKLWYLEVRFPQWCKYPLEPPIILIRTKISDIPNSVCLRINKKLIDLSRELAKDGVPSVYSMVEFLQNNDEIISYLHQNVSFKYPNANQSIFDYDPYQEFVEEEKFENRPSHYKQGTINKFSVRTVSPEQIQQDNVQIVKNFVKKQQDSYYQQMMKVRKELPAWSQKREILETIRNNQIIIISGETGCGKSTQVPQFLLDEWMENGSKSGKSENIDIICTQPRRISAIGVAERVADERNEKVNVWSFANNLMKSLVSLFLDFF